MIAVLLLLASGHELGAAQAAKPAIPAITVNELSSLAGPGAIGSSLATATAPDGTAWLSWLESSPHTPGESVLRVATFNPADEQWRALPDVARGHAWLQSRADFPCLAIGPVGHVTALWYVNNPADPTSTSSHSHHAEGRRAFYSQTPDRGQTWTAGQLLTAETGVTEFGRNGGEPFGKRFLRTF